jgi:Asp-tRNA(Asn)/Glu-tRNA(Gln) amidotransferase A subunit family amidase
MDLTQLGARDAAALIVEERLTAVALTEACLERIEARDGEVRAWAHLDPEAALEQARACDARAPAGPLHGVPVGIKDIMDTADMPTEYGSPIYRDHRPARDAISVAKVRAAGGVVLGKTVSTEFAHRQPNIQTRNPHDPARTPGGSSSGSAAAVADFMVPLAFGTQTGGSIIRPASYCGVYGYKPTYDTIAVTGVKPLAPGLDTVGTFARNLDDMAWFGAALSNDEPIDILAWPGAAPRVGLTRSYEWSQAEAATVEAVEAAAAGLDEAGAEVTEVTLPRAFAGLAEAHQTIMCVEAAQALAWERENHLDLVCTPTRDLLDRGAGISVEAYDSALTLARKCRARLAEAFAGNDVLLTASAQGEAPIGLEWTGDPVFNRNWTLLHVPCVTIPFSLGPNGMPVGVQLVARPGEHERLFSAAKWIATRLRL